MLQGIKARLPIAAKYSVPPLGVALLFVLVWVLPSTWQAKLTYELDLIYAGQIWRLITGQWVHLELEHLAMNLLGLLFYWLLFAEHTSGVRFIGYVLAISFCSSFGMFLFDTKIAHYVGFSGTLYGLFAWGACQDIRKKIPMGWLILVVILSKVSYDYFFHAIALFGTDAEALAVSAHFYGVLGGVLIASSFSFLCCKR